MDDNRIEIVARLDTSRAAVVKIEADLSKITDQLNKDQALKIIANVDLGKTTQRINSQLATIGKNLKLDIGNINFNSNTNTAVKQMESLGKAATQTQKEIKKVENSLANISGDYLNPIQPVNKGGYMDADATMRALKKQLSSLGQTISVTGNYGDEEESQALKSMTAEIKAASGEVRTLTFEWSEFDKAFFATTGKFSDKGIGKVQQDIVRLEKELANFKSSHQAIETGLTEPLTKATDAINNLKVGVGSVETAQKALDNLKTVAANIGSNLKSTGSSFNVFDNATNKAKNFDNIIKTLKMDIESLSPSASKSSLVSQLDLAIERMSEFKNVESKSGRGVEWSQRYGEISSLLQNVTNNLKVAQKEESAFNKEFEKAVKEEEKQLAVEQKRIEVAKQLREEQQHDYWQGRFEESVKGMTAENQVLKDMKKYYEDLNKAQKEVERQEKKTFQEDNKLANRQNRIKRLIADINSYAAANERAVKSTKQMSDGMTFTDKWSSLSQMAQNADLTDRELKKLVADMAVFKKEASATGISGASAFDKFAKSFKLVSTYISANQLINMAISKIREAVEELKNVDNILTEISKTSERSAESLSKLGKGSFDVASKYGRTASDYLLGVQEMSRAGFGEVESENLAQLSLLAQSAGDMTAELANEYIIATNAAYGYQGSLDGLNDVLD